MHKDYEVKNSQGLTIAHFGMKFISSYNSDWEVLSNIAFNAEPTSRDWEGNEPECECGTCDISRAAHAAFEPIIQKTRTECSDYALYLGYLEAITDVGLTFFVSEDENTAKMQLYVETDELAITRDLCGFSVSDAHDCVYTCFNNPTVIENTETHVILKFIKEI